MNKSKKKLAGANEKFGVPVKYDKKLDSYSGKILPSAKYENFNKLRENSDLKALLAD